MKISGMESRKFATLILLAVGLASLLHVRWGSGLIHDGGLHALGEIATSLVNPNLSYDVLINATVGAWVTLAYAVAGMTVALMIGFPLGVVASGVLPKSAWIRHISVVGVRPVLAFLRSIHELVWAWLFVAAFGLSPMSAVLALGIPYGGVLGRIYAEIIQDVPEAPLRALRSAGASEIQLLWYGRLPMALPDMLSYTFYRLECGVRSAAILSFVGLGGLGFQIQTALGDLQYERMWTSLYFLMGLVALIDICGGMLRSRLSAWAMPAG